MAENVVYDYLIVGAGLFGAVFARQAMDQGKKVLVIDRRDHIAGNAYTREAEGIHVHEYGAHIFHTSDSEVWNYVNRFAEFNNYINSPLARYQGEQYNLPFNMNTFYQMWGVKTPAEAREKIAKQVAEAGITDPKNLEEQGISLIGRDIYEKLVKGYTEKQWGKKATELPAFIIKRLPVRYIYDNNYFNDRYQGIPLGGYTKLVENLLQGAEIRLGTNFFDNREEYFAQAEKVIYTGLIDEYFDFQLGKLEYRGLRFETERLAEDNHQGNAVVNYTEYQVPYTRMIEHKHFMKGEAVPEDVTFVTKEYPLAAQESEEPYYPVNDEKNNALYKRYQELANQQEKVIFGGRLGMYQYFDMDKVIRAALDVATKELS